MASNRPNPARRRRAVEDNKPINNFQSLLLAAAIGVVIFAAFVPALKNGFVDWDDRANFLQNPNYRGLGWANLKWMFTTFWTGPYQPLSWVTLGLDYTVWGMNPFGYHLTNVLLHAANGVLFYFLSMRLLGLAFRPSAPQDEQGSETTADIAVAAGFSALFFGIHPLRVESVAWVTERRDVLSGFFYLPAILSYVKAGATKRSYRLASLVFFCLSLLSKGMAITFPIVLLLLDIYPLRRLPEDPKLWLSSAVPLIKEKISFLIAALAASVVGFLGQAQAGSMRSLEPNSVTSRLTQTAFGLTFYLYKTLLPLQLSPCYQARTYDLAGPSVAAKIGLLIGVSLIMFRMRRRWPAGLVVWFYYVVTLIPVSGIVKIGAQIAADHYTYLPNLGWALLAGGGLLASWRRFSGTRRLLSLTASTLIVVWLGALTWQQTKIWYDPVSLWTHILKLDPDNTRGNLNLAKILSQQGRDAEAFQYYMRALNAAPARRSGNAWLIP